jgi:hypothetical protein|tara:strand:+ start:31 stop:351 length:321 start_codon:yes stop_codon:yes gene_type:complete
MELTTQEKREKVTRVVDINTNVALSLLVTDEIESHAKYYKMNQVNAYKRILRNVDIMYGLSKMDDEDKAYTESLKDGLKQFLFEFKKQYRKEVEKGLGYTQEELTL